MRGRYTYYNDATAHHEHRRTRPLLRTPHAFPKSRRPRFSELRLISAPEFGMS